MNYETQIALRRSRRAGYLLGKRKALQPRDREAAIRLARGAISHLTDVDAHALIVEGALAGDDDAKILRSCSTLLGALVVLIRRMSLLQRALFIGQVFNEMRRLMREYAPNGEVEHETLH